MTHAFALSAEVANFPALERLIREINDLQSKLIPLVGSSGKLTSRYTLPDYRAVVCAVKRSAMASPRCRSGCRRFFVACSIPLTRRTTTR